MAVTRCRLSWISCVVCADWYRNGINAHPVLKGPRSVHAWQQLKLDELPLLCHSQAASLQLEIRMKVTCKPYVQFHRDVSLLILEAF